MASASLVGQHRAACNSSGVSVGISRWSCSSVVMRFLSCQRQSFQSASETAPKTAAGGTKLFKEIKLAISPLLFSLPTK